MVRTTGWRADPSLGQKLARQAPVSTAVEDGSAMTQEGVCLRMAQRWSPADALEPYSRHRRSQRSMGPYAGTPSQSCGAMMPFMPTLPETAQCKGGGAFRSRTTVKRQKPCQCEHGDIEAGDRTTIPAIQRVCCCERPAGFSQKHKVPWVRSCAGRVPTSEPGAPCRPG